MKHTDLIKDLKKLGDKNLVATYERFFKEYHREGETFLGIRVPELRRTALEYIDLPLAEVKKLLPSTVHEVRYAAFELLVGKFNRGDEKVKKQIFDFYIKNKQYVSNWDYVDTSAPTIVGEWLMDKDRRLLYELAKSKRLWDRRIAMVSTWRLIRAGETKDTFRLAKIFLNDKEDLMHKATGWMLREAGKKDVKKLEAFLEKHAHQMPRTMLRYSIEKFDEKKRKYYMNK